MVTFHNKEHIQIGKSGSIYESVIVSAARYSGDITIGDNVLIGPYTVIVSWDHGFDNSLVPICLQKEKGLDINIGNDVWIGANCTVLKGSIIPDGCVIGANCVITKKDKLEPYSVYCGNPIRFIKKRTNILLKTKKKIKIKNKIKIKRKYRKGDNGSII